MTILARYAKNEVILSVVTYAHHLIILVSANQCLGLHRDLSQDEVWYCPPCQKEMKLKDKAKTENWTQQKLTDQLSILKQQRETFALPKREYIDPVPMLRQITDFQTSSSEDEEQDGEEGTITRIGNMFQVNIPEFGKISVRNNECRKIWDSHKLPVQMVEDYLIQAQKMWAVSYLNSLVPYNEQDACKILHIKRYNVQNALQAIVHERLPYVVLTEHDKIRQEQDLAELRSGYSLSMD
ncbi:hypothetical protein SteCoe_23050 [Stentor coeruleus]|uniref:ELM2 domain-containing protein n=1 Tax=Stentor coeruleus TaxID=5963 RepID=A0A1R2BKR1_9CILI|nr:hypothetical protein SteCoe_23050 [Stentor coeruleus]